MDPIWNRKKYEIQRLGKNGGQHCFYWGSVFFHEKHPKMDEIEQDNNGICSIFVDFKLSQCYGLIQNTSAKGHSLIHFVIGHARAISVALTSDCESDWSHHGHHLILGASMLPLKIERFPPGPQNVLKIDFSAQTLA